MLQPYIESATSDYYYYYYIEIARISVLCRVAEINFPCFAGPRKVSVDFEYDVPCL